LSPTQNSQLIYIAFCFLRAIINNVINRRDKSWENLRRFTEFNSFIYSFDKWMKVHAIRLPESHIDCMAREYSFYVRINIARFYDTWLVIRSGSCVRAINFVRYSYNATQQRMQSMTNIITRYQKWLIVN